MPPEDTWKVLVVAEDNQQELGTFNAIRRDEYTGYLDCADYLEILGNFYTGCGDIGYFHAYKNKVLYASIKPMARMHAQAGAYYSGVLFILPSDLVAPKPELVCTCGGWAVYGRDADIHADNVANTCDLRKK